MNASPAELCKMLRSFSPTTVVGLTSGCFDLTHFYHLHYLRRCKAECDYLIVGVDSDALLTSNKHKCPNFPEYHRASLIEEFRCVDAVFIMRNINEFNQLAVLSHKVFKNDLTIYGQPVVLPSGVELVIIPDVIEVQSTSALVAKIRGSSPTSPQSPKQALLDKWVVGGLSEDEDKLLTEKEKADYIEENSDYTPRERRLQLRHEREAREKAQRFSPSVPLSLNSLPG